MICPECNGRGETTYYYVGKDSDTNALTFEERIGICRTCNGSGKMPMTNADRIRAMSDEELANWMAERNVNESTLLLLNPRHELTAIQIEAIKHTIYCACRQWLKQPAETENVDRCVCCGSIIPEGQMVCPNCLVTVKEG